MDRHTMMCRQPATRWEDALPAGNGRLGALVYGGIRHERILLNHEALWARTKPPELPDFSACLRRVRELLGRAEYGDAQRVMSETFASMGFGPETIHIDPFLPAFDLCIEAQPRAVFKKYRRAVAFDTGEVAVQWQEDNIACERRLFVSRKDDVIVMSVRRKQSRATNGAIRLVPHPRSATDPESNQHKTFQVSAEKGWVFAEGTACTGVRFGGVARVVAHGGRTEAGADHVSAADAEELVVLLDLFVDEDLAAAKSRLQAKLAGLRADYEALRGRHVAEHRALFMRMTLDLDGGEQREWPNEDLLAHAYDDAASNALVERMFDHGRYLLMSSSHKGEWPTHLQGVWNGDYLPAWSCCYTNDLNVEMCYWPALAGHLKETLYPYFDYYEKMVPDNQENARKLFGCRGIVVPIGQSTHGKHAWTPWCAWTAAAGWIAQLFYDYFLFTEDRKFLRDRAVPYLKQVALFYEDFLFESRDGRLAFSPSFSPENHPNRPGPLYVVMNAAMDVAVAKEVLSNLCHACEWLGIESEGVARWKGMIEKLPPYERNHEGAFKEWLHPDLPDHYAHRHMSHLYPLFPGLEIANESDSPWSDAIRSAVRKRSAAQDEALVGWSFPLLANIFARLGEGEDALDALNLLVRSCVGPNLFTHIVDWRNQGITGRAEHLAIDKRGYIRDRVFQIEANLGLTAAVLEMLVFSSPGLLKLLPALPAAWARGSAQGIACRGVITVSIEWDMVSADRFLHARIESDREQALELEFPEEPVRIEGPGAVATLCETHRKPRRCRLALPAGQPVSLRAHF